MTCQKGKRNFSYRGLFRLLCVKGAVGASRLRDCFFYNPSRRGLQVCFAHSQIPPTAARFPNPSRRGLQACFAHSQIPCVKGAPPKAVRDCFYNPSTTSWSPSPYTREAHSAFPSRDLRVYEAHLQASPRRVRKPRSDWRDLRVHAVRLQASPRGGWVAAAG